MNMQRSIKCVSAALAISLAWGCGSSQQVANRTTTSAVYDDLYASAGDIRSSSLGQRPVFVAEEEDYDRYPYSRTYRGNDTTGGTNEYYSQNWLDSRSAYRSTPYQSYGYNNYNYNYGLNNWYYNPSISFGWGYNRWSPYSSMWSSYDPYYAWGGGGYYDPWAWGSSRWMYSYGGWGYSPYNYGYYSYYDPWRFNNSYYSFNRNNYSYNYGTNIGGANPNVSSNNVRPRTRTYSNSTYNGDFDNSRSNPRGNRSTSDVSSNDYYSRPRRDGSRSGTNNYNNNNTNSSWDWSSNNNSNSNRSTNSWSNSSSNTSSGSSSGSSSGGSSGGGGGRSRGPR